MAPVKNLVIGIGLLLWTNPLWAQESGTVWFYCVEPSDLNPTIYWVLDSGTQKIVTLQKGQYFGLFVSPGIYSFSYTAAPAHDQTIAIAVNPGQQAFLEVGPRNIVPAAIERAVSAIQGLRPVNQGRVFDPPVVVAPEPVHAAPQNVAVPAKVAPPAQIQTQTQPSPRSSDVSQNETPVAAAPTQTARAELQGTSALVKTPLQQGTPQTQTQVLRRYATQKKFEVTILDLQSSNTSYTYVIPGYSNSNSNTTVDCNGFGNTVNCSGSTRTTGFSTPGRVGGYEVRGATLSLQLPDGRVAVVNCERKYSPKGDYVNRRSCRMPLVSNIQAEFDGDNAKLKWLVSIDSKKMESETYKIVAILDKP